MAGQIPHEGFVTEEVALDASLLYINTDEVGKVLYILFELDSGENIELNIDYDLPFRFEISLVTSMFLRNRFIIFVEGFTINNVNHKIKYTVNMYHSSKQSFMFNMEQYSKLLD